MTTTRPIKKIGEIVKFSQGIQVPVEEQHTEQAPGFVRFLRIIDFTQGGQEPRYIKNLGERYFVNEDELSMVRYGNPGLICRGLNGIIANNLFRITPIIDIDKNFLYYYFKSSRFTKYIENTCFGAAMKAINFSGLNKLEIPLPPLATQRAIVAKLDEAFSQIDEAIALTQDNIRSTEEFTKSVLDKAYNGGEWENVNIGEVVDFSQGIQVPIEHQIPEQKDGFVRFLRIIDFTQGGQEHRFIENLGKRYFVNEEDLSMVRYGATTGFICTGKSGIIANNLFKITPKIDMNKRFIYYFFKSSVFQNYLNSAVFGAAMPAINFSGLNKLEVPLPPLSKQQEIVTYLDQVFDQSSQLTSQYKAKLVELRALKASVLQGAFEGKLV